MEQLKVLISHSHDEKELAAAWGKLIEDSCLGAIQTWFSSDTSPKGGLPIGTEWRNELYDKLAECDLILALQTPESTGRPWIIWECGVASGINKVRGIIPIVYAMDLGELANPLASYQAYKGDSKSNVLEVINRLAQEAGLTVPLPRHAYAQPLKVYHKAIALHQPRKPLQPERMELWRNRFEELIESGRASEVSGLRQQMYSSLSKPFKPSDPSVHELLSRVFLDQRDFESAIEETDYALELINDDIQLLYRKALALVELPNLATAEELIKRIITLNADLRLNSEIASLQGRINREKWQTTHNTNDLDAAIEAYRRAYEADKTGYFPGINAASLVLTKGDIKLATRIFNEVLATCEELRQRPNISYWIDFTAGEAQLGLGETTASLEDYKKGLARIPAPQPRHLASALKGVKRMAVAKNLTPEQTKLFEELLSP